MGAQLMQIKRKLIAVIAACCCMPAAFAQTQSWGVGAGYSEGPVLSIAHQTQVDQGWHGQLGYAPGSLTIKLDHQRHWWPRATRFGTVRLGAYSGLGLAGKSAQPSSDGRDEYFGRIPLGVQSKFRKLHLHLFAETALSIGPVPKTSVAGTGAAGIRAMF